MIQYIVSDKDSQLISLNLKGNALTDYAAVKISESMRRNTSLTNLNLASNLISMSSVRQMMNILAKSLTLHRLDLRNNQPIFSSSDVMEVQFKLQENASLVHVILQEEYEAIDTTARHHHNAYYHLPPPSHPNPLLRYDVILAWFPLSIVSSICITIMSIVKWWRSIPNSTANHS